MNLILRILLTAGLAGVFLFCLFGFLATFEPGEASSMLAFRVVYGVAEVLVLFGLVKVWRRKQNRHEGSPPSR
jgi:uncharacterized membrane protein YbhN (UPF0104 family)